jgi:hypothetical protein
MVISRDLQTPTVKEEICHYNSQYSARLGAHSKDPTVNLIVQPDNRQLQIHVVQTGYGVHPESYKKGTGNSFLGGKATRT